MKIYEGTVARLNTKDSNLLSIPIPQRSVTVVMFRISDLLESKTYKKRIFCETFPLSAVLLYLHLKKNILLKYNSEEILV